MKSRQNNYFRTIAAASLLLLVFALVPATAQTIPGFTSPSSKADASQEAAQPSRTSELIELLKDDEARNQLISELEAQQASASNEPFQAEPPKASQPFLTRIFVAVKSWFEIELPSFFARLKRVPQTLQLAEQGIATKDLAQPLQNGLLVGLVCYSLLYGLRVLLSPISRRLNASGANASWMKLLGLRTLATLVSLTPLIIALFGGFFF